MDAEHNPLAGSGRPHYRPPIGVPPPTVEGPRRWAGTLASVALHVIVVLALLTPLLASDQVRERVLGAGDSGPAGGGGGGNRGRGGRGWLQVRESLHYVDVAPPAATPPPAPPTPPVPPPQPAVVPPAVPPVVPPPVAPPVRPVTPPAPPTSAVTPAATPTASTASTSSVALATGGSGTGTDGTAGDGPGSGGGVGSGIGTGQGSGVGAGRGGDSAGGVFLPTPTETILPPFETPASVRGTEIVVTFEIDEQGRILSVTFPPTRDGGYNRKLRERLRGYRFRPGHTPDGQPVRATYQLTISPS
jgi:hypothetical protein